MLSHLGPDGEARMVDVSGKEVTQREATASARVSMRAEVLDMLMAGALEKGDAIATARVAGIQAAKRTSDWIPMCHPLGLDWVRVEFRVGPVRKSGAGELEIRCTAKTSSRTGVEMEAMTGVSAAALTIYDMAKAADKGIVIGPIRLERKTGGKSGTYEREPS